MELIEPNWAIKPLSGNSDHCVFIGNDNNILVILITVCMLAMPSLPRNTQ